MNHSHHHPHQQANDPVSQDTGKVNPMSSSNFRLAMSATWHCLIGCGIGEVSGMIIATAIGLNNLHSILLAVILGFIGGFLLGIIPLRKAGFSLQKAVKIVLLTEGLSILVMETFEVLTEVMMPGVMNAHLTDAIFWIGMIAALAVGFMAAFPVNYVMIKRGIRHYH